MNAFLQFKTKLNLEFPATPGDPYSGTIACRLSALSHVIGGSSTTSDSEITYALSVIVAIIRDYQQWAQWPPLLESFTPEEYFTLERVKAIIEAEYLKGLDSEIYIEDDALVIHLSHSKEGVVRKALPIVFRIPSYGILNEIDNLLWRISLRRQYLLAWLPPSLATRRDYV